MLLIKGVTLSAVQDSIYGGYIEVQVCVLATLNAWMSVDGGGKVYADSKGAINQRSNCHPPILT